jgi:predicted ATPase
MSDHLQHDFKTTELDPNLLSTPFRVQTNWHVITGASCSGKTTLVDRLADKGFKTRPEFARQYFKRELAKGHTIDEIREDRATVTRQLIDSWMRSESGFQANEVAFLDRGLPDGLAHYRYAGLDPNELLSDCYQYRYASVFLRSFLRVD